MTAADELLAAALKKVDAKPLPTSDRAIKKAYSEKLSQVIALAFAEELRNRGLTETLPAVPGDVTGSGAERRLAGGIGAKKVDVTWTTAESGLMLGASIKCISWADGRTKNYQKNLTNRRGDMLIEAVTLHRRFPYAVLAGFMFLDWEGQSDETITRRSTFDNAHHRLRLFTRRPDPSGREEQYERLYLCLLDANQFKPRWRITEVGSAGLDLELSAVFDELITLVAERNFDFYEAMDGKLVPINRSASHRRENEPERGFLVPQDDGGADGDPADDGLDE